MQSLGPHRALGVEKKSVTKALGTGAPALPTLIPDGTVRKIPPA